MKKACSTPCIECPFTRGSIRGWLGGFGVEETKLAALSEDSFECHLTRESDNKKECAGRLLFAKNSFKVFRDKELENLKIEVVNNNKDILSNILNSRDFEDHHEPFK